jgi:hypothetical protein
LRAAVISNWQARMQPKYHCTTIAILCSTSDSLDILISIKSNKLQNELLGLINLSYFSNKFGWRNASAITWRRERGSQQKTGRFTLVSSVPSFNWERSFRVRPLYSSFPVSWAIAERDSSTIGTYSDSSSKLGTVDDCSFVSDQFWVPTSVNQLTITMIHQI